MNWKEFFKPTIWKIIITLIIFLLIPVNMWNGVLPERCLPEDINCTPMKVWFCKPLILQTENIEYNKTLYISKFSQGLNIIIYLSIQLIISYLISCIIILLCNKIKNKK